MSQTPPVLINSTDFAAYLLSQGFQLRGCRPNGRGCAFLFDNTPEIQNHLLKFTNGLARVEPRAFLRGINDLRDLARAELATA